MLENKLYDAIIIGGGISGLTAAFKLCNKDKEVILIEKAGFGGKLKNLPELTDCFMSTSMSGAAYTKILVDKLLKFKNLKILNEEVVYLNYKHGILQVALSDSSNIFGKTLIIATGTSPKTLTVPENIQGVYTDAVECAPALINKSAMVLGNDTEALLNALALAEFCKKVYICNKSSEFDGDKAVIAAVQKKENIISLVNGTIDCINTGKDGKVSSIKVKNNGTIKCSALIGIEGRVPETKLFSAFTKQDELGLILTDSDCNVFFPGIYAIGDCRQKTIYSMCSNITDAEVASAKAISFINAITIK